MPRGGIHCWNLGSFGSNRKICRSFAGFVILARPAHLCLCVCLCLIWSAFWSVCCCMFFLFFQYVRNQKFRVEAASPEFTLPLDYDKHRIKLGTKGEPVPYVFHPTHTDNGILWREQTWTELKVTQLSEYLQKHHQGPWFHKSTFKDIQNGVFRWNTMMYQNVSKCCLWKWRKLMHFKFPKIQVVTVTSFQVPGMRCWGLCCPHRQQILHCLMPRSRGICNLLVSGGNKLAGTANNQLAYFLTTLFLYAKFRTRPWEQQGLFG